jgi:hypothetical protein
MLWAEWATCTALPASAAASASSSAAAASASASLSVWMSSATRRAFAAVFASAW